MDNASEDGSAALFAEQPDISLWTTRASYRQSRFGMDWLGWLLMHYGHGHWCLTVDADELLLIGIDDVPMRRSWPLRDRLAAPMT